MRFVAFLRGINVGGHTVKLEHLRDLFAQLGFSRVDTYIQSGNVFFETAQSDRKALTRKIEQRLQGALGYGVPAFLRTIPELEHILSLDPFKGLKVTPDMRLCVMLTRDPIPENLSLPLRSPKKDIEILHTTRHEAFVIWHIINGRPPSLRGFLEEVLGETTTTRFFHTAVKILQAARKA